ncbi:MAG: hypothetical protein RL115_1657 [Bacteroidota bacterium]|jgi:NADH-quinone oxidoreductase subunit M
MIPILLITIPLVAGLLTFFLKKEGMERSWALGMATITLAIAVIGVTLPEGNALLQHTCTWLPALGSDFSVGMDGMGKLLVLLTALAFPIIFTTIFKSTYKKANNFFGLMLIGQAGLMGVFVATDALLFYFFWELALIPMYFLCSQWGGENRIRVSFKFFIYTFIGSLLMLIGLLWLQSKTVTHSFSLQSFYALKLSAKEQSGLFWLMFIAFAIKMPIFPLHTWQPDAYEQSPTAVTMVLSGVMVKMGLLGIIRWLLPVMPIAFHAWGDVVMSLSVVGIVYASLIAIRQDDIKRLVAYSSIAHIGLMCMALFSENISGVQGALVQMFNHGINIIGLWIMVDIIEKRFGTRKMSELGGLAKHHPVMAIFFVLIAFANIALPLTNAFPGEFLMFNGVINAQTSPLYAILFTVFAGMGIILGAVYTLNMVRKIFFGEVNAVYQQQTDLKLHEQIGLGVIVILILITGFFPQLLLNITEPFANTVTTAFVKIKS